MTTAALALALAVFVAPVTSRRRAGLLGKAGPSHRRPPAIVCVVLTGAALALVLPPAVVMAFGAAAGTVLVRRRRRARARDGADEAAALQGALDILVAELRVGAHPVAAISAAASESDGRIAESLSAVAARALLGADVAAGLRAEARRSMTPDHWDRLAVCWQLAQTHGLAIATLMQAAQRDLTERERFRARVEAGMAGARATAGVLAGLPLLGVLLGCAIGADPLGFLFSGGAGGWLLCIGTGLTGAGVLWSDAITSRVLT